MKRVLTALLILLLLALLIVGGYVAYLFIDYSRIEDNQALPVEQRAQGVLAAGEEQTIVSWNIGFGAYSADYSFFMDGGTESRAYSREAVEHNVETVIETLLAQNADILFVQELDEDATRSYHVNERQRIESAFSDAHSAVYAQNYHSSYLFYPVFKPHGASQSGILTLVNAQIDSAVRRSLPIESGVRKFFDLDRCYSVSRVPVDDGCTLCLFNLHLSAYTADGGIATKQLALLLEDMARERAAGNYVIAGGDFNKDVWGDSSAVTGISGENYSWAQPFPRELLPEGFSLVDSLNPDNPVLSCRGTDVPYEKGSTYEVTLDGFIVSDNVRVTGCEVIDTGFAVTDHNPVSMRFVLDANG